MHIYHSDYENVIPQRLIPDIRDEFFLNNENYVVTKKLGEGGFGSVYLVQNKATDEFFALKLLDLYKVSPTEFKNLKNRFALEFSTGKIKSDFLVKFYSIGSVLGNPYLLMEYCPGGNLLQQIHYPKSQTKALFVAFEIASGLKDLHDNEFVHRDIKPENILIASDGKHKISDFGIAANINNRLTTVNFMGKVVNNEIFGSIMYSPPEQLDDKLYFKYTLPSMDIYSYGILMYNVIFQGSDPFGGESAYKNNPTGFLKTKKKFLYSPDTELPNGYSLKWNDILQNCIKPQPKDRFQSVEDILNILFLIGDTDTEFSYKYKLSKNDTFGILQITHKHNDYYQTFNLRDMITKGIVDFSIGRQGEKIRNNLINLNPTGIEDFIVSKKHATIKLINNSLFVIDGQESIINGNKIYKPSLNGTLINGKKIQQSENKPLNFGDKIEIGSYVLEYVKSN